MMRATCRPLRRVLLLRHYAAAATGNLGDFTATTLTGETTALSAFKGNPTLIVNLATL